MKSKLIASGNLLGILQKSPNDWLKYGITENNNDGNLIKELVEKRKKARETKDFKLADEIRIKLNNLNIEIEDTSEGTKWRKKSN